MNIDDMITVLQTCRADAIGLEMICKNCPYRTYPNCITDLKEDIITVLRSIHNEQSGEMRLIDANAFDKWLENHEKAAAALEAADSDVFVDKDKKTYYSTQSFRDVMRYRPTINCVKKVVHFHQEFPEHDWARDEEGKN